MQSTIDSATLRQLGNVPATSGLTALARRIAGTAGQWLNNREQRERLARLDDRMLKDVGLDRATAYHEAGKWFWRP